MKQHTTASAHRPCSARWLTVDDLKNDGTRERWSEDSRPRAVKHADREGWLLSSFRAVRTILDHPALFVLLACRYLFCWLHDTIEASFDSTAWCCRSGKYVLCASNRSILRRSASFPALAGTQQARLCCSPPLTTWLVEISSTCGAEGTASQSSLLSTF